MVVLNCAVIKNTSRRRKYLTKLKGKYLDINNYNNISEIQRIKGLAQKVVSSYNSLPTIVVGDTDDCIIYKGKNLSLKDINTVYTESFRECKLLIKKLLLDQKLEVIYDDLIDNITETKYGYTFHNKTTKSRLYLLNVILNSLELRKEYILNIYSTSVTYNESKTKKYISLYNKYINNLNVLIHIESGIPARATEMESTRIENGHSTQRNIFLLKNQVFTFLEYNKTRGITLANKEIARFMDVNVSKLLIKDLLYFRPLIILFSNALNINHDNAYGLYLNVRGGKLMNSKVIRLNFKKLFYKYSNVSLEFRGYRQVAKYFSNKLIISGMLHEINSDNCKEENSYINKFNMQFGHTKEISRRSYGIHDYEMNTIREEVLLKYKNI